MFCDQCGKPLNANSKYCPFCGKPIVSLQEASPITECELTIDSTSHKSSQLGCQNIGIKKNNQTGFRMTTATMVVGIIFFVLILIVGIACTCIDVYNIINHEDEIKTLFENSKLKLIPKLIVLVDAGLISESVKGLVDIGKGKSYKNDAATTGTSSIFGIVVVGVAYFWGKEFFDFVGFIVTLIFSIVLFVMAITNEKATAK